MVVDDCHGYFEVLVQMVVDGGGEGAKFFIQIVFKLLDGLSKVILRDERVGVVAVLMVLTVRATLSLIDAWVRRIAV